jgi:prepilin-type processing-associated H-X9-DG protein
VFLSLLGISDKSLMACPVEPEVDNTDIWQFIFRGYGIHIGLDGRYYNYTRRTVLNGGYAGVAFYDNRPFSKLPLFADSVKNSTFVQTYYYDCRGYNSAAVDLKHMGRTNMVFHDGHTESLDVDALIDLGFTGWYQRDEGIWMQNY